MALPFSRSTRSLRRDRFLPGLVAIGLICAVLGLWMAWFFAGRLSVYAISEDYTLRDDGLVLGQFPAASLPQIRPGQTAELILPAQEGKPVDPIRAEVMNVPGADGGPVEIYLFSTEVTAATPKGQLKILLGQVTPAALIWTSMQK